MARVHSAIGAGAGPLVVPQRAMARPAPRKLPAKRALPAGPRALPFAPGLVLVPALLGPSLAAAISPRPFLSLSLAACSLLVGARWWSSQRLLQATVAAVALLGAMSVAGYMLVESTAQAVVSLAGTGVLAALLAARQERLRCHVRALEQQHQQLQTFLGMVSHDLRTPAASLQAYTQLLLRDRPAGQPDHWEEALTEIGHAATRMSRLTSDLVDAVRIQAGRFEVRAADMDLMAVAWETAGLALANAPTHTALLTGPERLHGCWDPARIGQVLQNLLSNAMKYSPPGSQVQVRIRAVEGEAEVRVIDVGPGMALEQQAALFQPFARLQQTGAVEGTGLGLYIAHAIVEAHGGRLWVESEVGKGSSFCLALPLPPMAGG